MTVGQFEKGSYGNPELQICKISEINQIYTYLKYMRGFRVPILKVM